ncbi:hypothetical protein [Actinomadura viridis]|uniref:Uncharacterized protein n=1 Tax=Actinomadura viridis TaxID=58110 RepID=A0A931DS51_9ACTN|nr:hypothetical protein [Actinomadura viridis]MBG6091703.1 hypothetical protein [Actinomadura viridis]
MFYQGWLGLESTLPNKPATTGHRKIYYILVIALLASTFACSSQTTSSNAPSASPTTRQGTIITKATFDSDGMVSTLPNIPTNVESAIPRELAQIKRWTAPFDNPHNRQFHVWNLFDSSHARILELRLSRMKNIKEARRDISEEKSEVANYRSKTEKDMVVTGDSRPVKELKAECISFPIKRNNAAPINGGDLTRYSVSGVRMYCRVINVGVSIQWEGMDYPSPVVTDRGKGLSYKGAEKQAIEIMKPIIFSLTPER